MIPKKIHYCWFGRGQKSELILRCIESWKKYCPDYEIIEWNEDNLDITQCDYAREAYEEKKWAFVSDYARLCVLEEHGGIYLDTDMQLLKPIDEFLDNEGVLAFEAKDYVCLGIIGVVKNHPFISLMKQEYETIYFRNDGSLDETTTNVQRMRKHLLSGGLKNNGKQQTVCGMTIYPQKLFFPYDFKMIFDIAPKSAYSIHHAAGSWKNNKINQNKIKLFKICLVNKARNLLGTDFITKIKTILN